LILLARETNAFIECILEHDREHIGVRGRDLGIEGTRRGRESARKIFKRGARRG
jgi:hypothetical protein